MRCSGQTGRCGKAQRRRSSHVAARRLQPAPVGAPPFAPPDASSALLPLLAMAHQGAPLVHNVDEEVEEALDLVPEDVPA
jgi:hypothetical protein